MTTARVRLLLLLIAATVAAVLASRPLAAGETTVAALARETHFHGIAVDLADPSRIYLATHDGLYLAAPDGSASLISASRDDFMGFTPHPGDPTVLFASGHPAEGGNLGFIVSRDGGRTWTKLADGVGGPVDFHQMDVSKADPKVVYGVYGNLQESRDGGRTWQQVGPPPEGLIQIAASAKDVRILYAATNNGLLRSLDGGRSWQAAYILRRPTSMVHVAANGDVYAYLVGSGLIRASEPTLSWQTVGPGPAGKFLLHLAVNPGDGRTLYAVALDGESHTEEVLTSRDGGASWSALGGE